MQKKKPAKEVEKSYKNSDVAAKLRRLADALEQGKSFQIQIDGRRVSIPPSAKVKFEFEESKTAAEVEIELSWKKE